MKSETPIAKLVARELTVELGSWMRTRVAHGVDISVTSGETVALVGESGSGKSTIARAITRLAPLGINLHAQGKVHFNETNVLALNRQELQAFRHSSSLAMIFQNPLSYLNPTATIRQQLAEACRRIDDRPKREARMRELLAEVELSGAQRVLSSHPHELSGGMRQRILIAMALALEPQILVADEPTSALDVTVQAQIIALLKKIQRRSGIGILLITHDLGIVAEMCDRAYVLKEGRVVEEGPVVELFERPQHEYTQELLGAAREVYGNSVAGADA